MIDAPSWGVEHLTVKERYQKAIEAGADQFGGQLRPQPIIELVEEGLVSEERLDASVRRILRLKFKLGLFDNPYVDASAAGASVGTAEFRAAGVLAQRKSVILLKNADQGEGNLLPLKGRPKLYVENIALETAEKYGDVVSAPEEADFAILRLATPYDPPRGSSFLENFFHQGDLVFKGEEKARILNILEGTPTIVDIYLDRAAVIPEIAGACAGLLASFGVTDEVMLDAIFGNFSPSGKLPVEMPSSMAAVRAQKEDVPYDSENPLFPFGFGLGY